MSCQMTCRVIILNTMGWREEKAQQKHLRIIKVGLRRFEQKGFEQTTMEEIARGAEVSLSTLYRSFPTKESILLAAFKEDAEILARTLESIPVDVLAPEALGRALVTAFEASAGQQHRTLLLRSILDVTPSARASLWDLLSEQRDRIGRDLARRLKLKAHDPRVILSARTALLIAETAADLWRAPGNRKSPQAIIASLLRIASDGSLVLPTPVDRAKT